MSTSYPGGNDTHIPDLDLSGNLMIGFSRNVKKYPVTRYMTPTPVKLKRGPYLYFNPLDNARLPNLPQANKWASGTIRPASFGTSRGFEQKTFTCQRYSFSTLLDMEGIEQANWPVLERNSEELAHDAMVARSIRGCTKLTTQSLYPAANVVTAASLTGAGNFLDLGTSAAPYLFKALSSADLIIQNGTGGRVQPGELSVLMNHNTAVRLARSREIREYVMQQEQAYKQITMDKDSFNGSYYLPDVLFRHNVVVESLQYNANNRGASGEAFGPVFPDNTLLVFCKPGDLDGNEGEADYSTGHIFIYEDLKVETFPDQRNRVTEIVITDTTAEEVTAAPTGVIITNIFS